MAKIEEVKQRLVRSIDNKVGEDSGSTEKYCRSLLWLNLCELVDKVIELVLTSKTNKEI